MSLLSPGVTGRKKAPGVEPFLWDSRDVMSFLGCGRTKLWEIDGAGLIGPKVYIGRTPKWQAPNVRAYALKGDR